MENKKTCGKNNELNSEKDSIPEPKSLSEYLFKLLIVVVLVGIIFYTYQKAIVHFFGENIYVLSIFGFALLYFIKYLVSKISRYFKK